MGIEDIPLKVKSPPFLVDPLSTGRHPDPSIVYLQSKYTMFYINVKENVENYALFF